MSLRVTRWIAGLSGAIIAHLAVFWAVALVTPRKPAGTGPTKPQTMSVEYLDASSVRQQLTLFDPRPLLIPTRWNVAGTQAISEIVQEERDIFEDYQPVFQSASGDFIATYGNRLGSSDDYALTELPWSEPGFKGMGTRHTPPPAAQPDELEMAVIDPGTGNVVSRRTIALPEATALADSWPDWRPVTYLATVEQSFLLGGMPVLSSSGYEEVDLRLEELVARRMMPLGGLPDGPYLVEVGP